MKAEQSAGAASDVSGHWREVDWRSVTGAVRRLQVCIVKAVETGRWGKVKALQRLLTTSRSGKLLAAFRALEDQGLIESLSEERSFFKLTGEGYAIADELEEFASWNTSSIVLHA
jgi:hypothetical protein